MKKLSFKSPVDLTISINTYNSHLLNNSESLKIGETALLRELFKRVMINLKKGIDNPYLISTNNLELSKAINCKSKTTIFNYRKKLESFNFILDTYNHGWMANYQILLNPEFFILESNLNNKISSLNLINQNLVSLKNLEKNRKNNDSLKTSLESYKQRFFSLYDTNNVSFFLFLNNYTRYTASVEMLKTSEKKVSNSPTLFFDLDFFKKEKTFKAGYGTGFTQNLKGGRKISKNKPVEPLKFKNDTNTPKNKNNRSEALKVAKKLDIIMSNDILVNNLTEKQKYFADKIIEIALKTMFGCMEIFPSQIYSMTENIYMQYSKIPDNIVEYQHNIYLESMKCTLRYYHNHKNRTRFLPSAYFDFNSKYGINQAIKYYLGKRNQEHQNIDKKIRNKKKIYDFNTNKDFQTALKIIKPVLGVFEFEEIMQKIFKQEYVNSK